MDSRWTWFKSPNSLPAEVSLKFLCKNGASLKKDAKLVSCYQLIFQTIPLVLGFDSCQELGLSSPRHRVQISSGVDPASYPINTRDSFRVGKAAGLEADHSPPPSEEVKIEWRYMSIPSIRFHSVVLN